jgi:cytoskeletal protein RodZ
MFLAEFDPIQIAIVVIAMLGGFVQWIWGLIKQGQEEAARRSTPPISEEEKKLREQAWRHQVQPSPGLPAPPRPKTATPPPANDPWASVRDIFEQIKKDVIDAQPPQRPAPTQKPFAQPPRKLPETVRAEAPQTKQPVLAPAQPAIAAPQTAPALPTPQKDGIDRLRGLLATQASIRQAVLMREILGPPKALQSSSDSTF